MNRFTKRILFLVFLSLTMLALAKSDAWSGELHTSVVTFEPGTDREAGCIVTNVGNSTKDVTVTIVGADVLTGGQTSHIGTTTLAPGEVSFIVISIFPAAPTLAYCSFTFSGSNDSMRGIIRMTDVVGGKVVVLERAEAR
jgi:hypothetical protein